MKLEQRTIDGIEVLTLQGRFDVNVAPKVRGIIEEVTEKTPAFVVVNLQDVDFLDSTGLAILVQGKKRAISRNGMVILCSLRQPVRIIFELTRLDTFFDIYPTEGEAIAAFKHSSHD